MISLVAKQHEIKQTTNNWLNFDLKPHCLHGTFSDYLVLGILLVSLKPGLQGKKHLDLPPTLLRNHLPIQRTPRSLYNHYLWDQGTFFLVSFHCRSRTTRPGNLAVSLCTNIVKLSLNFSFLSPMNVSFPSPLMMILNDNDGMNPFNYLHWFIPLPCGFLEASRHMQP